MNFNIWKMFQAYRAGQLDKRVVKKFFLIVGSITGAYLVVVFAVTMYLLAGSSNIDVSPNFIPNPEPAPSLSNGITATVPSESSEEDDGDILRPPSRTNVLVLGIDEFGLADVVIVGSFDRNNGDINLLHIPRDTFTQLPQSRIDCMRQNVRWVPADGIMKINALRSLGGRQFGAHYMKEQLGETLGIEFHYYMEIHLDAFREIVDLVGGVEIEVPRGMQYRDPYQNLNINIPAGVHLMDGRMAEHFVRYRGYADADLGRVSAQQQFMTQLFRQTLRRETIMQDPIGIARVALRHVETDIGLDLIRYIPYVGLLSPERISTYTLPGNERRIHGASYFVPDHERIPEVINRMFFGVVPEVELEDMTVAVTAAPNPSMYATISVLNGTRIGGVASGVADRLHLAGYQIGHIGLYAGTQEYRTRINVREEGLGEDLLDYFNNAIVRVDPHMSGDFDIVIIVGRSER